MAAFDLVDQDFPRPDTPELAAKSSQGGAVWSRRQPQYGIDCGFIEGGCFSEPVRERVGAFQRTPKGYIFSFEMEDPAEDTPASISKTTSSIYLPHQKIRPQMSREEFESLVAAAEQGQSA